MNDKAVTYIIDQTEMSVMFCEDKYVQRLIEMKKEGKIVTMQKIVNFDDKMNLKEECQAVGIELLSFSEVI